MEKQTLKRKQSDRENEDLQSEQQSSQDSSLSVINDVKLIEIFPKYEMICDSPNLDVPFTELCGEYVVKLGRTLEGVLALSNYRLYYADENTSCNIPLAVVEKVVAYVNCIVILRKDMRAIRIKLIPEQIQDWYKSILSSTGTYKQLEEIFAFAFYAWATEENNEGLLHRLTTSARNTSYFENEWQRLEYDTMAFQKTNNMSSTAGSINNLPLGWRISHANENFALCSTYPKQLIVPSSISDEELLRICVFRKNERLPVVVYRHKANGAVIARSSQPNVGILYWRCNLDEKIVHEISRICNPDHYPNSRKIFIMDARTYSHAVVNRVSGGGVESEGYYNCQIGYMDLPNIHVVRGNANALRNLIFTADNDSCWLSGLEKTGWLSSISKLLAAASTIVKFVNDEARPVLVHCSDGWDRTPQVVSLAELFLDSYYRTMDGFEVLVQREWLDFGHKFANRSGTEVLKTDQNELCPVFLQWLDCVYQLTVQFPSQFEFTEDFLLKVADHTYSNLFGTFLCNSLQERLINHIDNRTFSMWPFVKRNKRFKNPLYIKSDDILRPRCDVRNINVWRRAYFTEAQDCSSQPDCNISHNDCVPVVVKCEPPNYDETSEGASANIDCTDITKTDEMCNSSEEPYENYPTYPNNQESDIITVNLEDYDATVKSEPLNCDIDQEALLSIIKSQANVAAEPTDSDSQEGCSSPVPKKSRHSECDSDSHFAYNDEPPPPPPPENDSQADDDVSRLVISCVQSLSDMPLHQQQLLCLTQSGVQQQSQHSNSSDSAASLINFPKVKQSSLDLDGFETRLDPMQRRMREMVSKIKCGILWSDLFFSLTPHTQRNERLEVSWCLARLKLHENITISKCRCCNDNDLRNLKDDSSSDEDPWLPSTYTNTCRLCGGEYIYRPVSSPSSSPSTTILSTISSVAKSLRRLSASDSSTLSSL